MYLDQGYEMKYCFIVNFTELQFSEQIYWYFLISYCFYFIIILTRNVPILDSKNRSIPAVSQFLDFDYYLLILIIRNCLLNSDS